MHRRILFFSLLLITAGTSAWAQASPAPDIEPFAPLDHWKAAVLSRDSSSLKQFYSVTPVAQVATAHGEIGSEADVNFWIALKPKAIKLKMVQASAPKPDVEVVAFQAEVQSAATDKDETVYISEAQVWQKQGDDWKLVSAKRTQAAHLEQPLRHDKNIYPPDADARAEIKEAEERAAKEHKRVLLVFGANWCYDCHVLDLAFQRPDFAPVMSGYEVVHVDIGEDGKKNADLAREFQVPLEKGIPALAVLDSSGKLLVSQKNGEFENARAMTPQSLLEFLNKWKPRG